MWELDTRFHTPGWAEKRLKELQQMKWQKYEEGSSPLPPNTLTNVDGTPYAARHDAELKRFLIIPEGRDEGVLLEGVIFSDGTIVIHGATFRACIFTEAELKQKFPNAWVQRLD